MQQANYTALRDGFITKAKTLTQYFVQPWQVSDDASNVNRGAKYLMILRPGAVPIAPVPGLQSKKLFRVSWQISFDLQVKYVSFKESWSEFTMLRDAVLNKFVFTMDPSIPGTFGVWNILITAPDPPGQQPETGAPTWLGQTLIATLEQQIDVSR
jgi:hypothetical protein